MLYHNVMVMAHYRRSLDAVLVGLASVGGWAAGAREGLWDAGATRDGIAVFSLALSAGFAWLSGRFGVYKARRTEHFQRELTALGEALVVAMGIGCMVAEVATTGLPGPVYACGLAATSLALLIVHGGMRLVIRGLRRAGREYRVWLLVGRNARSAEIAEGILANPHFGVRLSQIVDFRPANRGADGERVACFQQPPLSGVAQREVAGTDAIRQILENEIVDEVVVTLPLRSHYDEVRQILELCGEAGISVKFSTDVFEARRTKTQLQHVGQIPMVTHFTGPADDSQLMVKRAIDVLAAAGALILLAPVLAAIALAIRLRSRGPALYVQTRIGLHGRPFRMVKFRTMVPDADKIRHAIDDRNEAEVAFKIKDDPRVTSIGRVLRRYHLDELPQLWNVLVGDMSLVGPRALPPQEASGREWWQRRRLTMPPGMTCSWQAAGTQKHKMPFRKWVELDLAYIDQWSVWLDLRLIFRTLLMLPRGSGW